MTDYDRTVAPGRSFLGKGFRIWTIESVDPDGVICTATSPSATKRIERARFFVSDVRRTLTRPRDS